MILRLRGLRIDENVEIGLREKKERFFGRTVGTGRPGEGGIICTSRSMDDQLPDFLTFCLGFGRLILLQKILTQAKGLDYFFSIN
jgi:hypothetical protein